MIFTYHYYYATRLMAERRITLADEFLESKTWHRNIARVCVVLGLCSTIFALILLGWQKLSSNIGLASVFTTISIFGLVLMVSIYIEVTQSAKRLALKGVKMVYNMHMYSFRIAVLVSCVLTFMFNGETRNLCFKGRKA
jgi:hypothetical protein